MNNKEKITLGIGLAMALTIVPVSITAANAQFSGALECTDFVHQSRLVDTTVQFFAMDNYEVTDFVQNNQTGTLEVHIQQQGNENAFEDTVSDFFLCNNYTLTEYTAFEDGSIRINGEVSN